MLVDRIHLGDIDRLFGGDDEDEYEDDDPLYGPGTLLGHGYTVDRFYRRRSWTPSSFHIHSKL